MPSIAPSTDFSTIYGNCHLWERASQKVFSSLIVLSLVSFWSCSSYQSQSLPGQMDKKIFEMTKGNEYTRQGLQMQAKLSMETGKDLTHLSGMTYLNALLFDRYKKVLYKKVRNWVLSLVVILVALEALRYYLGPFELTDAILLRFLPFSFMIMYIAS